MKKILPVLLLTLISLTFLPAVFAEDATSATTPREQLLIQKKAQQLNRLDAKKDKIASRAALLRTKLEAFKDRKKAEITERISDNLNKINLNRTDQMSIHLTKMSDILNRLEKKVTDASGSAAVKDAKAAIATASTAVSAQSQKDYTVSVSSERRAGIEAKTARDQLFKDLQNARKLVITAKQSVADAIRKVNRGQ